MLNLEGNSDCSNDWPTFMIVRKFDCIPISLYHIGPAPADAGTWEELVNGDLSLSFSLYCVSFQKTKVPPQKNLINLQ